MKEAAGEANLTVIAIILIAVVVAVATPLVSSLMKNSAWKSCCTDNGGKVKGTNCVQVKSDGTEGTSKTSSEMVNSDGSCADITW